MYRPSTSRKMCVYPPPPPQGEGKEERKKRSSALPTPFLPLRPLLQPPAAPSHSSYEPRAGRSEYNFLYCVNVRTIRLNKKKNVYITKRRRLDHCVSHSSPSSRTSTRETRVSQRFTSMSSRCGRTWRFFRILIPLWISVPRLFLSM